MLQLIAVYYETMMIINYIQYHRLFFFYPTSSYVDGDCQVIAAVTAAGNERCCSKRHNY